MKLLVLYLLYTFIMLKNCEHFPTYRGFKNVGSESGTKIHCKIKRFRSPQIFIEYEFSMPVENFGFEEDARVLVPDTG